MPLPAPSPQPPAPVVQRAPNLDLFRFGAIAAIVLYHVRELVPAQAQGVLRLLDSGWTGVDLFLVLSGWLVGGLYWQELKACGDVEIGRFWGRRFLRTIPPYLVILQVAYYAKQRLGEPGLAYDWGYWACIQNYYERRPYWGLSWFVCIEQHFYLGLPLFLLAARRLGRFIHLAFAAAVCVSLASRILTTAPDAPLSGLHYTATHNRLEGLALGVWASYAYCFDPLLWERLKRWSRFFWLPALFLAVLVCGLRQHFVNTVGFTLLAVGFAGLAVRFADAPALPGARRRVVRFIAGCAYSIYLTQNMCIHAYERAACARWPAAPPLLHAVGALLLILLVGAGCYLALELPALWLRDRLFPRRLRPAAGRLESQPCPAAERP